MNTLRLTRYLRPLRHRIGLIQQCWNMPNPLCPPVSQLRFSGSETLQVKKPVYINSRSSVGKPPEWSMITEYAKMTQAEAETKLNISIDKLPTISLEEMLGSIPKVSSSLKCLVYEKIVGSSTLKYPTGLPESGWVTPKAGDLVLFAIMPVLSDIICTFELKAAMYRAQTMDKEFQELEGTTLIKLAEERHALIIEAKQNNTLSGLKQLLLGMKDVVEHSGPARKVYYGYTTTGAAWRMVDYDGKDFRISPEMHLVFDGLAENKDKWLKDYSKVIDCLHFGLSRSL